MTNQLLTSKEVQNMLQVDRQTLLSWRKKGLPYIQVTQRSIRYDRAELEKWLEERSIKK